MGIGVQHFKQVYNIPNIYYFTNSDTVVLKYTNLLFAVAIKSFSNINTGKVQFGCGWM